MSPILTDIRNHARIQRCDHGLHWMFGFIKNRLHHGILSYTLNLSKQISILSYFFFFSQDTQNITAKKHTNKEVLSNIKLLFVFLTTFTLCNTYCILLLTTSGTGYDNQCMTFQLQHEVQMLSLTYSSALMQKQAHQWWWKHTWCTPILGLEDLSIS